MKIVIEKDKIINIDDININSGSIQYYKIYFEFDESWNDLTKKVIIINRKTGQAKELAIIDNYIYLDIFESGDYSIGVVGYTLNEENEKEYQISTNLKTICIRKGAGQFKATINEIPTISEWEIYINQIQELCNGVVIKNIEEEVDGLNHNFTINYTDGTSFEFTIKDGENASSEGTSNYNNLINKPQINGVPLEGNKTSKDLGIKQEYTANDIAFEDGETFQEKYNKGELRGDTGEPGPQGEPGTDGKQGPQGNPGPAGTDGENGFSPTVTTTPIENGTKVDITDINGVKSFEVLNGKNGEQGLQGEPGPQGNPGKDGKTPIKGVDYFTEEDKQEFVNEVEQALTPQLNNKLDKNQGAENSGKFLGIGADGLVVPKDVPSTGGGSSTNDTFGEILIAEYTHEGNQEIHFSEFDWETCIGTTTEPHELSEATPVQVVPNNWVNNFSGTKIDTAMCSVPIEWMLYNGVMYLLPLDGNRVQVVKSDKQTPIAVNPDNIQSNSKIDFAKFHFEIPIGVEILNLDKDIAIKKMKIVICGAGSRAKGSRYLAVNNNYLVLVGSIPGLSAKNNIYHNFIYKIKAIVEYGNRFSPNNEFKVEYVSQREGYSFFVGDAKEQTGFLLTSYLNSDKTIKSFQNLDQYAFLTNGTTVKFYALEGEYNES